MVLSSTSAHIYSNGILAAICGNGISTRCNDGNGDCDTDNGNSNCMKITKIDGKTKWYLHLWLAKPSYTLTLIRETSSHSSISSNSKGRTGSNKSRCKSPGTSSSLTGPLPPPGHGHALDAVLLGVGVLFLPGGQRVGRLGHVGGGHQTGRSAGPDGGVGRGHDDPEGPPPRAWHGRLGGTADGLWRGAVLRHTAHAPDGGRGLHRRLALQVSEVLIDSV